MSSILGTLYLSFGLLTLPLHAAPPAYPCYQPTQPPLVDGNIAGDPAWHSLPAATGFSTLGDGYTTSKQTVVQACWDDSALYVAMACEEPDVARLKPEMRDGGPFWLEDSVELFLQPGAGKQVLQFGVTASGAKGGFEGFPDFTRYQAAAGTGVDSYSLEIRIPFALLTATPTLGDKWRVNFCRNIFTTVSGGDKFTGWAPLQAKFLEPENFGTLTFHGPAPAPAEAARLSAQLNGAYRKHLTAGLRAVVGQGKDYREILDRASQDEAFGGRASELRRQWREADDLLSQAGLAPLQELRRATASVAALVQASYDLKYAYLIANLFQD